MNTNTKLSFWIYLLAICFPVVSMAQGGKTAVSLTDFSQYLEISKEGTTDFDFGADQDFTIEFWFSVPAETPGFGSDPAFIADKDWDSGNNSGFIIFLEDGAIRCNVGTGNSRLDIDHNYNIEDDKWHHVALSGDRDGDLNLLVDGVIVGTTSMVGFGNMTSSNNIQIGRDGVGGYTNIKFKMDELRFWNEALSAEDIQTNMCVKADENAENLIAYYSFDDATQTEFADAVGGHNITVPSQGPTLVASGAHIGDESLAMYTQDWTDVVLGLNSPNIGAGVVNNIQGVEGVQLYYVEAQPNENNGYLPLENEGGYFGMHLAAITQGSADVFYNYEGYDAAEAAAAGETFSMFYRSHGGEPAWANSGAYHNQEGKSFFIPGASYSAQVVLGNTLDGICPNPYSFEVSNVGLLSAGISWGADGLVSEVAYGLAGFDIESGIIISDIEASSIELTDLSPNNTYEAYVRHSCVGLDPSEWVGPVTFTTEALPVIERIGAGTAIDFVGGDNGQNNYIDLGDINITDNSFTVEMWLNVKSVEGDPAFFSNKNWGSGTNTGFNISMLGSGGFRVNYKTADSPREDVNSTASLVGAWNHIAVVVNREENLTLYLNGIEVNAIDISSTVGSIEGAYPFVLGQDGTGSYVDGHQFNGYIDELRVWNGVRTEAQLRENMCIVLEGTEDDLISYFPFDNAAGGVSNDHANEFNHATLINTTDANWVPSAAPIGDEAVLSYSDSTTAIIDLILSSEFHGTLSTSGATDLKGVQVYRKDQAPNHNTGFDLLPGDQIQFGVFTIGDSGSVNVTYDYTGWAEAEAAIDGLGLYGRTSLDSPFWLNTNATQNESAFTTSISQRREFMVGIPLVGTCEDPSELSAVPSVYSGEVSWITGGSNNWNISYGAVGITPEEGTRINFTGDNPHSILGLNPATSYHFFVQDSCVGIGTSAWVGPYEFTTMDIPAYLNTGAGTALLFDGNQTSSHGTPEVLRIDSAITLEAWVNPSDVASDWESVFSYLQDNGSDESGYGFVNYSGKMRMFIMTEESAGNAWNSAPGAVIEVGKWSHIAGTYDGETIKFYLNGILMEEKPATGNIDWEFLPIDFRIGTYFDDNEDVRYYGQADEIRIWNRALTAEEIRTNMCQKLVGDEENLMAYFNLNDGPGSIYVTDLSVNANHGVLVGDFDINNVWPVSGAHIGDESATIYGSDLMTSPISVNSDLYGTISLLANDENVSGAHVYRINQNPGTSELSHLNEEASHFGMFVVGQGEVSYTYDYSAYSEAVAAEDDLMLFSRSNGASSLWTIADTDNNTETNVLSGITTSTQQVYLASNASTCAMPTGMTFSDEQVSSVVLNWDEVEGASFNVIYGNVGAYIQDGTLVEGITTNQLFIDSLQANANFEYYIQVICDEESSSYWVGPIPFNTLICQAPENVQVEDVTSNSVTISWEGGSLPSYTMEWGPLGFPQGFGIQFQTDELPVVITPLAPNTQYEFYVQTVCGEWGESVWIGPFFFTTESASGITEYSDFNTKLYPNPAQNSIILTSDLLSETGSIQIFDVTGKIMIEVNTGANASEEIQVSSLEAGVYILKINTVKSTQTIRFVKQ